MVEIKKVYGQNGITSVDTYFESVRKVNHVSYSDIEIKVAGPDFYDNQMNLETYEEDELLSEFVGNRDDPVVILEDLGGHSIRAFYQDARLIGFQRR